MKKVKMENADKYTQFKIARSIIVNGNIIADSGTTLTLEIIEKIKESGGNVQFIFIDSDDSIGIMLDDIFPISTKTEMRNVISEFFKTYSYDEEDDFKELKELVKFIMEKVYSRRVISENIDVLFEGERNVATHCLNVAILSTILAIKAGLPKHVVEDIALGGSLHDIGKVALYKKFPRLGDLNYAYTDEDYRLMQAHPVIGYNLLKDSDIPTAVKKMILMHHVWERPEESYSERVGTLESYPTHYEGKPISPKHKDLAISILQAVDVFESMVNEDRTYRRKNSRIDAINYIKRHQGVRFGKGAELLTRFISPYGIGDEVILSDGNNALVYEHTNETEKPIVKVVTGDRTGEIINLKLEENLKIVREY